MGDLLNIIINSGEFIIKKKGYKFMNFEERREVIFGFSWVDKVMKCIGAKI